MPIDRMSLPCWTCPRPEAADVRRWLGSASDDDVEQQLSPSGRWPLICCHVRLVGVIPHTEPDRAAPGRR
jgi:hypothetical protein